MTFKSLLVPKYPARVMVTSAITRAIVPASVDKRPPLYVPRESLDDMTRERSDRLTPVNVSQINRERDSECKECKTLPKETGHHQD